MEPGNGLLVNIDKKLGCQKISSKECYKETGVTHHAGKGGGGGGLMDGQCE